MKKALAIFITIILALVAGFAGGVYYVNNFSEDYDSSEIEAKIVEIAELAALECDYTDVGEFKGDAKKVLGFEIPLTKKAMKIQYSGTIKMGPDLKNNMVVDLDKASDTVKVSIPHSEILSHEIDEGSMTIVYIKNGVFNSVTPENTNKLRKETKAKKEKAIMDSDYLDKADENAVKQITTFLKSVYPNLNVEVEVRK